MRDPKRIRPLMEIVTEVWECYPDLRFWQVLNVIMGNVPDSVKGTDPFYWEDDVWEEIFSKTLDNAIKQ